MTNETTSAEGSASDEAYVERDPQPAERDQQNSVHLI
jgi:hypothetical protein